MNATPHPAPVTLVQQLTRRATGEAGGPPPQAVRIPVQAYTSEEQLGREQRALFSRLPLIIGHESQLAEPGDALVHDWLGMPLITLCDAGGAIRTVLNVCRHRGMRLVAERGQTRLRSLVCPYHQWTYGLDGQLRNIPLKESFGVIDPDQLGLVQLPTEVRHGLVWIQATPGKTMDLDAHLAGLGSDLDGFGFPDLHFGQQHVREVQCNWKLIQDAFLDGYHVTRLHKLSVGPFFADSMAEYDRIGRHFRSAVARREIFDTPGLAPEQLDLRHHVSFAYTVFPNAVLVLHPEYTSVISLFPLAADRTLFAHTMLTPQPLSSEQQRDHFRRSFELIDQGVFQSEDIFAAQGTQQGLASGANEGLLFGGLEAAATEFHSLVEEALAEQEAVL